MATQKPISTISYNTESFLKEKLDSLIDNHTIQAYQYIFHKGEDGDKDHIHLRVEPNKRLDPMDLGELFIEYKIGEKRPLKCLTWRPSKEEDWFLYVVHDSDYLKYKYGGGESKEKLPYDWKQIVVSDGYELETVFIRAKASLLHSNASIASRIEKGEKPLNLIKEGINPILINSISNAFYKAQYSEIMEAYQSVRYELDMIYDALEESGLTVNMDATGHFRISPIGENEN